MPRVQLGIDRLQQMAYRPLRGRRVALFTNPSGVNSRLQSTYDLLWQSDAVQLAALFAPEHGASAAVQAGIPIAKARDPRTGIPLFSLYGADCRPSAEAMRQIDLVVVDIQDVGARYYTYLWSLTYLLEACAQHGVPMLVLDRPNPLGDAISGPLLQNECASFVGRFPIPVQHGMTIGEIAQMANAEWLPSPAELQVIPCSGLLRAMTWRAAGLSWVAPSPNMPHLSTVRHYPGACLLEGTNLSEGRGTALPFEIAGAPWLDGHRLSQTLRQTHPPLPPTRPISFTPTMSKHAGKLCHGVQLHAAADFDAFRSWLEILRAIHALHPREFALLPPHRPAQPAHFDRLLGIARRPALSALPAALDAQIQADRKHFARQRAPFLLYS